MTDVKPREFWIETHELLKNEYVLPFELRRWPQVYETEMPKTIHVIEKSAYDTLKAQNDELIEALGEVREEITKADVHLMDRGSRTYANTCLLDALKIIYKALALAKVRGKTNENN